MIVSPSTILLQPLVGRFHASDQAKIRIFCRWSGNVWPSLEENRAQQGSGWYPNIQIDQLDFP